MPISRTPAAQRPALTQRLSRPPRFLVSATRADGHTDHWHRCGGSSIDHALEAQEAAGLGGVVRVVPLALQATP